MLETEGQKIEKRTRSLTSTLALAFLAINTAILLIAGTLQLYFHTGAQSKVVTASRQLVAKDAAISVANFIRQRFNTMQTGIALSNPSAASKSQLKQILESMIGQEPSFRNLVFLNTEGNISTSVSRQSSIMAPAFFDRIEPHLFSHVKQDKQFIGNVYVDTENNEPLVTMSVAIPNLLGEFKGALVAEVNLKFMWDLVASLEIGKNGQTYVIDRNGDLLAAIDIARILRNEDLGHIEPVNAFVHRSNREQNQEATRYRGITGQMVVGVLIPLKTPDWAVITEIPVKEAYAGVIGYVIISVIILFIIGLLAVGTGVLVARRLAVPLINLTDTATRIADGKTQLLAPVQGPLEIALLAGAFNNMTRQLVNMISNEENRFNQLNREIQQRETVEKALRDSEEKHRVLYEKSRDAILLMDPETGFVDCNDAALLLFAVDSKEDLLGMTPIKLSPPIQSNGIPSSEAFKVVLEATLREGSNYFEWICQRKDGRNFPATVLATKMELEGRVFLQCTIRDITVRKKTEEDMRLLRNNLRNIIDSMPSVLVGVDASCHVTMWNKMAYKETGISVRDAGGKYIVDVFPGMLPEIDKIKHSIYTGEIKSESRKNLIDSGKIRYENLTIYPLISGSSQGAVIRIDDVSEKHELEEQLNHRNKMDAIGQLAGGIAHDFNNMLAGILGAAQLMKANEEELSSDNLRFLDMILQASTRAADLTSKLLAFGRKGKACSSDIDVHEIIDDTVSILASSLDKKIRIASEKKSAKATIVGDSSALQNAFMNLCINAAHAMPNGGEITIETTDTRLDRAYCDTSIFQLEPGDYLKIRIKDTGCGIPTETLPVIFEPFYTTKEEGKGTGLGLAAVYGTVREHDGAVEVFSEEGKGTSFHIYLPCSATSCRPINTKAKVVSGAGRILFVDDERIIRITGTLMLESMGYRVISAKNGKNAMEIFKKQHSEIDLVILDMIMPEMNGTETFYKMIDIDKNCKIVMSSGIARSDSVEELREAGLAGFIRKPYRDYELSKLLSEILEK